MNDHILLALLTLAESIILSYIIVNVSTYKGVGFTIVTFIPCYGFLLARNYALQTK